MNRVGLDRQRWEVGKVMEGREIQVIKSPEGGVASWRRTYCSSHPVKEKGKELGLGAWAELRGPMDSRCITST